MSRVRRSDMRGQPTTVRGLLIAVSTSVTATAAGITAAFLAATQVVSFGSLITGVVAVAAGLASAVTTALAVAHRLHRLIGTD